MLQVNDTRVWPALGLLVSQILDAIFFMTNSRFLILKKIVLYNAAFSCATRYAKNAMLCKYAKILQSHKLHIKKLMKNYH